MGIWQFTEAFAVSQQQSELKISEANAGAKLPECIACPDNNQDQPANDPRNSMVIPNNLY